MSDLVALPYSSGTTGLPKGVMLTHHNRVWISVLFSSAMHVTEADRFLLFLPIFHAYGIALLDCALSAGATTVLMKRFNPGECVQLLAQHHITVLPVVPPILMALLTWPDLHTFDLSSIRYVMSSAAPLAPSVAHTFRQLTGVRVLQSYGLTEVGPSHLNPIDNDDLNVLESIGLPISNTEQKVVDSETGVKELAVGEVGELCIRSPQVMAGYWKAPEATASALRDGWFHTGDIWASRPFAMRAGSKSHLYRHDVTDAAIQALLEAINKFESRTFVPEPLDYRREDVKGHLQASMKQADQAIDWRDLSASIFREDSLCR